MAGSGSWVVVLDKPIVLNIEQKNITPVKIKIDVEALDKNGIVTDFASKTIEYAG